MTFAHLRFLKWLVVSLSLAAANLKPKKQIGLPAHRRRSAEPPRGKASAPLGPEP